MDREKAALRAEVRTRRAQACLASEDAQRLPHLLRWLDGNHDEPGVAAVYASTPSEPGTGALLEALVVRGWRVLLPVLRRDPDWAWYEGRQALRPGWRSIPEPTTERLGAAALGRANLVVVSCLGTDDDGFRLGVGGGWYDRALPHRAPDASVLAWGRDAERGMRLPREAHDLPVDGVVTETGIHWFRPEGVH